MRGCCSSPGPRVKRARSARRPGELRFRGQGEKALERWRGRDLISLARKGNSYPFWVLHTTTWWRRFSVRRSGRGLIHRMHLILNDAAPIHWAAAGAGIAAVTLALLFVAHRRLGISSGFEDVCSLVLRAPYFRRASLLSARRWRLPFVLGLVIGG